MNAIASGADLIHVDRFGLTALHHAAICGHDEVVGYILLNSKYKLKMLTYINTIFVLQLSFS